jgi:hypothetical protein
MASRKNKTLTHLFDNPEKKKNSYQLEKKQSTADQKKIRDESRADYMPTPDYQPLFKKLTKLVPLERRY